MAETQRHFDAFSELLMKSGEQKLSLINKILQNVGKAQDHVKEFARKAQCETFQDEDLKESFENDVNDTTSWTIGQEPDKEENAPNTSSHEIVVQDIEEYILIEVKREEQCDPSSETHLKKEEVLGVQPTLQTQFKEKQNAPMFEPILDKVSILRTSKRKLFEESENPRELPSYIKLLYHKKLKREEVGTLTRNCSSIFQGWLPLKKKD